MNVIPLKQGRGWPLYAIAALVSVLLSAWIGWREQVINPDGICYLMSAEAFQVFSVGQVMQLCPQSGWPFYPWLIHAIMNATGWPSLVAANVLDGALSLLSVITFIKIVEALGGSRRVMAFAAFVILCAHEFNSVRQYVVRDHGYYAFYLLSIFFFLRVLVQPRLVSVVGWALSFVVATLFRVEGAVFLIALPFVSVFMPSLRGQRLRTFFWLLSPCLLAGVGLALLAAVHHEALPLGRLPELSQALTHSGAAIWQRYADTKAALIQYVLPLEAVRDAGVVWFLTLVIWYGVSLIQNVSFIAALLVIYAWVTRAAAWSRVHCQAVCAYLVVNLAITVVFFAQHLFLSKRYLLAFTLTLLLWVPFALERLYQSRVEGKGRKILYSLVMFSMLFSSLGVVLDRGPSKGYVREAGDWLATNVPDKASLYVNDFQLMYYAKHEGFDIFKKIPLNRDPKTLSDGRWNHYDYVALRIRGDDTRWTTIAIDMNKQPIRTFSGPHGDSILIYKIGT